MGGFNKGELMNKAEIQQLTLDGIDGVMGLLQVLVVALGKQGQLDTAAYAHLLLDYRKNLLEPESVQATLVDRMLRMLVDENPEVLVRRDGLHVLTKSEAAPPSDE
jgi:hypothetical protein